MSVSDSIYEIPAPLRRRSLVVPGVFALTAIVVAVVAVLTARGIMLVSSAVLLLAALALGLWLFLERRRRGARVRLSVHGLEVRMPGAPVQWLRWSDVRGVRTDGEVVEFHADPVDGAPRGLAIATPGESWERWEAFQTDVVARLDADRGYERVCEFDPQGGCANGLGCAGKDSCAGHDAR